jgi:hypothetical protein
MTTPRLSADPLARSHGLLREGLVTGAIGATAVALWFLLVDVLLGQPLQTPALLGAVVSNAAAPTSSGETLSLAALYTVVHYAVFAAVGIVATFLVHRADASPSLLGLLLMLFAATEVLFIGVVASLEVDALGSLAWYQVAAGNVVAAAAMGLYLFRRHRGLAASFRRAFEE